MSRCDALNICYDRFLPSDPMQEDMPLPQRLALVSDKMFQPGDRITVSFIGGSSAQRQHCLDVAKRLMEIANIKFEFVTGTGGMWRIAFNSSLGAWAFLGKDALSVSRQEATMNLGFDQPGTYTHEFLHAGAAAIHEHQNPFDNPIKWNKPQVYHDLGGPPNNWDRATIDSNMFAVYSKTQVNGTSYDPKSVMLYARPASWTIDGDKVDPNAVLSSEDIRWLSTKLPGVSTPPPPVDPPPPVGSFTRAAVHAINKAQRDAFNAKNPFYTPASNLLVSRIDTALQAAFPGMTLEEIHAACVDGLPDPGAFPELQ